MKVLRHATRRLVGPVVVIACLGAASADAQVTWSPGVAVLTEASRPGASGETAPYTGGRDAPSARFGWPVDPHVVARRFDPPEVVWGAGHRGVDLRSVPGAKVVAPATGVVTFSGSVAGRGVLTIRHPQGFDTTYEPVSHQVPTGSRVERGDHVADLEPGHCEPACLHWGYKTGPRTYRDPLTLVAAQRPVLLPPL